MFPIVLTIVGLILFEVINSVDNAVINAEVLGRMSPWARRWFLLWGIILGVFVIRGVLPWIIVWLSSGNLSLGEAFFASFSSDPLVHNAIEKSAPLLLIGAGVFLILLFLHWLFLEQKNFGLIGEKFIYRHGLWFFTIASVFLATVVWYAIHNDPMLAFAAVVGSSVFFLTHGFKENAEAMEKQMVEGKASMTDWSKILYLEVIDASFSIDGVLGAFAFTLSVPLILFGNGIGAVVVRWLTVSNIENVKKYKYLKNGAMYSIFFLGLVMLTDAFGADIPQWTSPVVTIVIFGYFFLKSFRLNRVMISQNK